MKTERFFRRILRQLISVIFVCLIFQTTVAQVTANTSAEEKRIETAKETVKAYETGNWEVLRRNATPDAMFYNLGSYDSLNLDQTVNYWTIGREKATPVLEENGVWIANEIPDGPKNGKWVLHWGKNTLTYPAGETISFPYHVAMKFAENKVQEVHFYYDNNRIIRAMGYEIQPPLEELSEDSVEH